jgi:hypothetical protein
MTVIGTSSGRMERLRLLFHGCPAPVQRGTPPAITAPAISGNGFPRPQLASRTALHLPRSLSTMLLSQVVADSK